jgi:hypothetical protein
VRRDAEHWFAHIEGSDEVLAVGSTRAEVVGLVRPVARGAAPSELVIHRRDGSIYLSPVHDASLKLSAWYSPNPPPAPNVEARQATDTAHPGRLAEERLSVPPLDATPSVDELQ